jgi:hypothetical protein
VVEYPRDGREFERRFVDEASCTAYLERLRWPTGFVCALRRSAMLADRDAAAAAALRVVSV